MQVPGNISARFRLAEALGNSGVSWDISSGLCMSISRHWSSYKDKAMCVLPSGDRTAATCTQSIVL